MSANAIATNHSLCERCRQLNANIFFLDPRRPDDYVDGPLWVRRTWNTGGSILDSSKAFWFGTVHEVKNRVETIRCELCEFVLDSTCAFWRKSQHGETEDGNYADRALKETILNVKDLSDDIFVCIFRWRRVSIEYSRLSETQKSEFHQWRDAARHVSIGAATKDDANAILEWDLEETFGRVKYSKELSDALNIEHEGPLSNSVVPSPTRKMPRGGPCFSMNWAIAALETCNTAYSHSRCRKPYATLGSNQAMVDLAKTARFIDLQRRRVVKGLEPVAYATLSYVWGAPATQTYCLLKSASFSKDPGRVSLGHQLPGRLPSTIEDAMKVAQSLSLNYLWVDSLCIMQDSDEDKAIQIQSMAAIYANAVVCIVDAAGQSANSGLSGISVKRSRSMAELSPTSKLKRNSWNIRAASKRSRWLKRGWTFQERALSPRCLIFYKDEVCFVCSVDSTDAEISRVAGDVSDIDTGRNRAWAHLCTAKDIESHSPNLTNQGLYRQPNYYNVLAMYQQAVVNYSRRELTYEEDILNAFSALGTMFARATASAMRFGVPERAMHRSLLWKPEAGNIRDRELSVDLPVAEVGTFDIQSQQLERRGKIPSWAWTAWKGPVSFCPPYNGTISGTQIAIMKPALVSELKLGQNTTDKAGLGVTTSSLLTLTKIAWLSLRVREGDSSSIKSANLINPETGTTQFSAERIAGDLRPGPQRLCTIEDGTIPSTTTVSAAFIQLGALQQTGISSKDDWGNRHSEEDECYILLVDVEPLAFQKITENPPTKDLLRKVMKDPEARRHLRSKAANYVDPLTERIILPKGRVHGHWELLIDAGSRMVYDEDAVFVARRKGIAHIPESIWRAARPKDAIVFLT